MAVMCAAISQDTSVNLDGRLTGKVFGVQVGGGSARGGFN